ncbi:hypothetical protein ACERNI_08510 [Camelimonas sp. ID_303_24]
MSNDNSMAPNPPVSTSNDGKIRQHQRLGFGAQDISFDELIGHLLARELRACQGNAKRAACLLETLSRASGSSVAVLSNGNALKVSKLLDALDAATRAAAAEASVELSGWMRPS